MIDGIFNALFGCRHKQLTRPITPVHKPGTKPDVTYVACLECGTRFFYDPATMSRGERFPPAPSSYPSLGRFQVQ